MGVLRKTVFPFTCAALLASISARPAIAVDVEEVRRATSLQLYGSWTPAVGGSVGQAISSWGLGAAIQWTVASHWQAGLDAARFSSERTRVTPLTLGMTYGPRQMSGIRPYAEMGGGYYQLTRLVDEVVALGASGNARDQFTGERANTYSHDAIGLYFGAGLAVGLSSRLGFDTGVRAHNWVDIDTSHRQWDGMLSFRSGLSYRF